ncbi:MAG: hypothetical protein ACJ0QC_07055 [Flavobacteriales bacterium]
MRNINFKSFFINIIIAFVITFSVSSCQEESPTRAIITVVDSDGAPAFDVCTVILSQQGLINSAGNESNVYESKKTSTNGTVEFEFVNEAILNIEATYVSGNDTYTAESVIKLVREELVRKTITVN